MGESGPVNAVKGVAEDLKGKVKEVVGSVSGDSALEREGEAQQDKASDEREVAEHEAKAEASRAEAEADERRQKAEQEAR